MANQLIPVNSDNFKEQIELAEKHIELLGQFEDK